MPKPGTHFQQISLAVVLKIIKQQRENQKVVKDPLKPREINQKPN